MDDFELRAHNKVLMDHIDLLERECDRLEAEIDEYEGRCDTLKAEIARESTLKAEVANALTIERERCGSLMRECISANDVAAKADARATSLATSLEAAETQVAIEQRSRMEAEKRCTEMMDSIKALLSIQAKAEKKEDVAENREEKFVDLDLEIVRDGNDVMRRVKVRQGA